MKAKPLAYAIAVLSTATANLSWGTESNDADVDTMVVSASRVTESVASIPYSIQVVEGADIQRQAQPGRNLGQILGQIVPGLAPGDDSATSNYQTLRGRKVLVLIDGVAQRASRDVSRQLTTIPAENIERIEIISGATAVYGAGATGGVINIITKRGSDQESNFNTKFGFTFSPEKIDSDSMTKFISQTVSGMAGDNFDYLVNLNLEKRGNYYDSEGNQIATDPNQTSRDNSDTIDLIANLGWQLGDDMSLRIGLEYFKEEQDTDYAADFGETDPTYGLPVGILATAGAYNPTPREGLELDEQPQTTRKSIALDFSHQDFWGHTLLSQLSYRDHDYYYYPYPNAPLFLDFDWFGVVSANPTNQAELLAAIEANRVGASGTLLQSHMNSEVTDFKLALNKSLNLNSTLLDITYGLDYTHDNSKQRSTEFSYSDWVSSGQTQYNATGSVYDAGPESTTNTGALFTQAKLQLNQKWILKAGIRYERAEVEVEDTISGVDISNAAYYQQELTDPFLQLIAASLAMTPQAFLSNIVNSYAAALKQTERLGYSDTAPLRKGGKEFYSEVLLNAGVVYAISSEQEVFANYSEGFTVPDMTRLLRSITILTDGGHQGPILESANIDAVKTDSYDIGWRGRFQQLTAQASLFYNKSDKNIEFDSVTGIVEIRDREERFWGAEALMDYNFNNGFNAGLTYSRTYGETKNDDGEWEYLKVDRVSPEKITGYLAHTWGKTADARLQFTHLSDYKKAEVPFEGFRTFDLLTTLYTGIGDFGFAIRNLTNAEYYSLYNQVRDSAPTYLPAQGRTFTLSYNINY